MEKDTNKLTRVCALDVIKKEYLAVRKHFNLSKIRAFLRHMKAKEEGTSIIKGEFFMSLNRKYRDELLLELIAYKSTPFIAISSF
jgi:hypothetical protein